VKSIHIVFVFDKITVKISHAIECRLKARDFHSVKFVQVGNELIPIGTYFKTKCFKPGFVEASLLVKP
jgi:hypothetical protein